MKVYLRSNIIIRRIWDFKQRLNLIWSNIVHVTIISILNYIQEQYTKFLSNSIAVSIIAYYLSCFVYISINKNVGYGHHFFYAHFYVIVYYLATNEAISFNVYFLTINIFSRRAVRSSIVQKKFIQG